MANLGESLRDRYVEVYFPAGCNQRTVDGLYQYDHGLKLRVKGLDSLKSVTTQFSYAGINNALSTICSLEPDGSIVSDIPDVVMFQPEKVYCYLYIEDEVSGYTVKEIRFPLLPRPKPSDVSLTPEQSDSFNALVAELNALIDRMEAANAHHPEIRNGNWWVWDVNAGAFIDTGNSAKGPKGDKGDNGKGIVSIEALSNGDWKLNYTDGTFDTVTNSVLNELIGKFDGMTVSAVSLPHGSTPTATMSDKDGVKHIEFGLVTGADGADGTDGADGSSGYQAFDIDENGYLYYERSEDVNVDFSLNESGELIVSGN